MGAHEWGALGDFISHFESSRLVSQDALPGPRSTNPTAAPPPLVTPEEPPPGVWHRTCPDLGPDSGFYCQQVARLREVTTSLGAPPPQWLIEGGAILQAHRHNYGPGGPKQLVVQWWNWPPEHWIELRDGASMNFLQEPVPGLIDNSDMTAEQLATATTFVDELIALGVLQSTTEPIENNFPLFLVTKALAGEWQCLADGKSGGKNDIGTSDPVHLGPLMIFYRSSTGRVQRRH
jgi:hypothetical protein